MSDLEIQLQKIEEQIQDTEDDIRRTRELLTKQQQELVLRHSLRSRIREAIANEEKQ